MFTEIIRFWFDEIDESQWWKKDRVFDRLIEDRFAALHREAARCELYQWRDNPEGRLAEIILLDQFSRNIYRGEPAAFSCDLLALALAQEAVRVGADKAVPVRMRSFFYMPFMHSESLAIHEAAVSLFAGLGQKGSLDFELKHKIIIERFGRYPHRNDILGRVSTAQELEFLAGPGSGF